MTMPFVEYIGLSNGVMLGVFFAGSFLAARTNKAAILLFASAIFALLFGSILANVLSIHLYLPYIGVSIFGFLFGIMASCFSSKLI